MTRRNRGTAICVIRMEPQADGTLISVRVNPDIQEMSGERQYHFADVDKALCAVRDFVQRVSHDVQVRDDCQPADDLEPPTGTAREQ